MDVVYPRCAGIDISKKDAKVGVRIQASGGKRTVSTVTTWGSMTNQVLALREHLLAEQVTCVVMEATGDYWRPFCQLPARRRAEGDAGQRPGREERARTEDGCFRCRVARRSRGPWVGAGLVRAARADPCAAGI